ncbi:hypothetical protein NDU88_006743 [Pleurodeles waltl]|uniref:Uncharacterized protein n=1 Tax=Pleurodeles waltl TaxID=8319 RepID=A0AAV7L8E3_PLEWA|nr:hypothetical protein NDU88_006743 [Pleurodeles waltl]
MLWGISHQLCTGEGGLRARVQLRVEHGEGRTGRAVAGGAPPAGVTRGVAGCAPVGEGGLLGTGLRAA